MNEIENQFNQLNEAVFSIGGNMDYSGITEAIICLVNLIAEYDDDSESLWYLGEGGVCTLDDFIIGAYWHYTEWHGGQDSIGYAALSALGSIFTPGMSSPEEDNLAYQMLNEIAEDYFKFKG